MGPIERLHLEIVDAIAEHGTMTAAAEHLGLTQSALSHSMTKLESQLSVSLWHREGRRLRSTPEGDVLVRLARRLLPQLTQTEETLIQMGRGDRGSLTLGVECHPCYSWLTGVAAQFLAEWPEFDLDIRQKFQFGGMAALFQHEIDLLITPDPLFRSGLLYEPVFDYEAIVAVAAQHRLAHQSWIAPADLAEETLLTYPVSVDRLDVFSRFLTPAGIPPKRHKTVETTEILLQMVSAGRGVAALPRWLVEESSERAKLHALALGREGIFKQIFVGFRKDDEAIPALQGFLGLAKARR